MDKERDLIKIFKIRIFGGLGWHRIWIDVVGWGAQMIAQSMVDGNNEREMRDYNGVIGMVLVFA